MAENLNMNTVNQIQKNTVIYRTDEPLTSVGLLLKGRVLVEADGIKTVFSSGNFLGACDVDHDTHSFTYTAYDNVVLYVFPVQSPNDFEKVLQKSEDYYGLINTSLNFFITELHRTFEKLEDECKSLRNFVCEQYDLYLKTGEKKGISTEYLSSVDSFREEPREDILLYKKIPYYVASSAIPVVAQKNFYMGSQFVSLYHFSEQKQCVFSLLDALSERSKEMLRYFRIMILDEKNLFSLTAEMAMNVGHMGKENAGEVSAVDNLLQKINDIETFLVDKVGQNVSVNRDKMEKIYFALLSGDIPDSVDLNIKDNLSDLENSLEQILSYASIDKEIKEEFILHINDFKALPNKFSKSDDVSKIRRKVSTHYYSIYESVFLKSLEDNNPPTAVRLFLSYGYVCETLLSEEQLTVLLSLKPKEGYKDGSRVYTMPEWLKAIYEMRKVPSKNEFDQDYEQYLKQKSQETRMDKEEEKRLLNDPKERVRFEIQNMFRYANRVLHGKITSFVPILLSEGFTTAIESSYLTADKINGKMAEIEAIDFSIYYREKVVFYEEVNINKETVFKKYYPDIILFPICGQNSLMWQDIIGKKRTTKGRFYFPIFFEPDLEKEMLKITGEFRWEICRSEQGMHWNDIQYPSLVSEYTDYLQFYRKNSALSAETKEKIKSQLVQSNNKHRTVFTKDYADWILREANSAMRVNKVVRRILATYCPFRKDIRIKLNEQQVNAEAGKRFVIERNKRLRQIEGSCSKFDKAGLPIPKELEDMRNYLKNT